MALSDRAVSQLCQRLEDRPQPLRQPGSGDDLARQVMLTNKKNAEREQGMELMLPRAAAALLVGLVLTVGASAAEVPKRGGTLTYMIPADAPPSFDGHRESTFATVHGAAPFYSLLIRVNPKDPSSTTDFVCDLCAAMPTPTDDGKTYTFKIREGVKFHDGTPLTADDVAASWRAIIHPQEGVSSARESYYIMVDTVEAPDPTTVVF